VRERERARVRERECVCEQEESVCWQSVMHKSITPALFTVIQDTLIGNDPADKASDAAGLTGKIDLCYPTAAPIYPCTLRLKGRATWWRAMLACDRRQGCEEIILDGIELACDKDAIKPHPTFEVSGGAKFSVLDSVIRGCSSSSSGGFIRAYDNSLVKFLNSAVHASQSSESGGAVALYGSTLEVFSSLFYHCRSTGSGGAIWSDIFLARPSPAISSSIFALRFLVGWWSHVRRDWDIDTRIL
jgi:hypothetical protein